MSFDLTNYFYNGPFARKMVEQMNTGSGDYIHTYIHIHTHTYIYIHTHP
jgi:hypothetical protein